MSPASTWKPQRHGVLEPLAENLWRVRGSLPGIALERVMTVARRDDGGLVLHSAIALDEPGMAALDALGSPRVLLVPNGYHRLDAPAYKQRYPELQVLAPSGSRRKVEQRIHCDGVYEDLIPDGAVELHTLPGTADREGAMLVRSRDGLTVVLNDVVFNMHEPRALLARLVTKLLGSAPGPRVSRLAKLGLISDKRVLRDELERLAALPTLVRLIVSHDQVSHGPDAARALRTAMTYLE